MCICTVCTHIFVRSRHSDGVQWCALHSFSECTHGTAGWQSKGSRHQISLAHHCQQESGVPHRHHSAREGLPGRGGWMWSSAGMEEAPEATRLQSDAILPPPAMNKHQCARWHVE